MKTLSVLFVTIIGLLLNSFKITGEVQPVHKSDISEFLGQWIINYKDGGINWLEIKQEEGFLYGELVWRTGPVRHVSDVYLVNNEYLVVTRTIETVLERDENNNPLRSHTITGWFEIRVNKNDISGFYLEPRKNGMGIDSIAFTGKRMPPMPEAPDLLNLKYGKPITLFNGKNLTGWRLTDTSKINGFVVIDGILVNNYVQKENEPMIKYGDIRTDQEFKDFNLKLEVNLSEGCNSGIYLRGMYEVQVYDSYNKPLTSGNTMASINGRIAPSVNAEKPAGTWQSLDITLCNRHVTVILNNIKIIDNKPVDGPTGGAIKSDVLAPGPICLQGSYSKVSYRNIILTPIITE
jgi:hypothetical protein